MLINGCYTKANIVIASFGIGGQYLFFNVAHFFLAYKYKAIAKKVPAKLNGQPEEPETQCEKGTFWTLLATNIISAILYGVTFCDLYLAVFVRREPIKHFTAILKYIATYATAFCGIVSGVILVRGVIQIRRFFKERDATDFINLPMLTRHAAAFGLYLLSTTLWAFATMLRNMFPYSSTVAVMYAKVSTGDFIVQFIA